MFLIKDILYLNVNNLDVIKEFPKDINYQYYFIEASKIVQRFQTKQLTLF